MSSSKDRSFNFKLFSPLTTPDYNRAKKKLKKKHKSDVDSDVSMVTRDIREEVESVKKKAIEEKKETSDDDLFKTQLFPSSQESRKPNKQMHSNSSSESELSSSSIVITELKKKTVGKTSDETHVSSIQKLDQNSDRIDLMLSNVNARVSNEARTFESVTSTSGWKRKSCDSDEESAKSPRKKQKLSGNKEKHGTDFGGVSSTKTQTSAKKTSQTLAHSDSGDKKSSRIMNENVYFDTKDSVSTTKVLKEKSKTKNIQLSKHTKERLVQNDDSSNSDSENSELDSKTDKTSKNNKRRSSSSDSETQDSAGKLRALNGNKKASFKQGSKTSRKGRSYSSHNISSSSDSSGDEQDKGKKPAETNIEKKKDGNHSGSTRGDKIEQKSVLCEKTKSSTDSDGEKKFAEGVSSSAKKGPKETNMERVKDKERRSTSSESNSSAISSVLPYDNATVVNMNTSQNAEADNIDMEVDGGSNANNRKEISESDSESDINDTIDGYRPPKNFAIRDFKKINFSDDDQFRGKKLFLIKASAGVDIDSYAYSRCKERINVTGKTSIGIEDKPNRVIFNVNHNPPKEVQQIRLMCRSRSSFCSYLTFGKAIEGQIHITSEASALENVTFNKQHHQKHKVVENRQKTLTPFGSESPIRETVMEEQDIDYNSTQSRKDRKSQHTGDVEKVKVHKSKKKKTSLDVPDSVESTVVSENEHKKKKKKEKRKRESDETKDTVVHFDEEDNQHKIKLIQEGLGDTSENAFISTHKHKKKKKKKSKIKGEPEEDQKQSMYTGEELGKINGRVTEFERRGTCDIPDDGQATEKKKKRKKKKAKKDLL